MCSYDSTCDHLPLADLCHKEATYSQFEAFVISRKIKTDSISLGPLPPWSVRPPFYRLSGLSVLCTKTENLISFFTCICKARRCIRPKLTAA